MDKPQKQCVVFDYTSFLGASCAKKWTFLEAMSSMVPGVSHLLANRPEKPVPVEERLWTSALNSLSPSYSDEVNLLTLVGIAKDEGIDQLKVVMPYSLEQKQIDAIQKQCDFAIDSSHQEEFTVHL
ncbi:transporter [Vibrio sp. ZSDE26]|uniref:Transporter n=1 Tax=Vibrio amylolyticus TaxID=2847292 RepID=A0A9X1XGZ4_9VIBR|nr:transporter [Vibrio amylolyticus]MCK6261840.1 transporter [Vibrio amylolyticus]